MTTRGSTHGAGHGSSTRLANVRIAPTLETMAQLYKLPREGGATSERFRAYVKRTPLEPGLIPYNPMAGPAALETVEALLAVDAEALALETAQKTVAQCDWHDDFTLCIAVRSAGLWTHRVATEVEERAGVKPRTPAFGLVSVWSREPNTPNDVVRESAAESVRVMWTTMHGAASSVRALLAREGLAYAIASHHATLGPYAAPLTDDETIAVMGALDILGDSGDPGDMAGVLFGDVACTTLGWTPLGVPENAGYKWAIARAMQHVAELGAPAALRAGVNP